MITWNRSTTSQSPTLTHHLTVAIDDYWFAFGHAPALIQIPYWRGYELDQNLLDLACAGAPKFRGVPFRFSIESDWIELGSP